MSRRVERRDRSCGAISQSALAAWRRSAAGGKARAMFSAAVSGSNREKCWNTMPMAGLSATAGDVMATGWPFQTISPALG